jgi:glycosyltransferase involved in cell wall biosynthesis
VREYIAAAAQVRRSHPEVEFHLVGPYDSNPSSLTPAEVEAAVANQSVIYHGGTLDVRPHLRSCHVYVLPSYREGTPRSVLEALAVGRPVITTDAPGCRETVIDGETGYLVAPGQVEPLARAMVKLIEMELQAVAQMGLAARRLAQTRFDVLQVNAQVTAVLEQAAAGILRQDVR